MPLHRPGPRWPLGAPHLGGQPADDSSGGLRQGASGAARRRRWDAAAARRASLASGEPGRPELPDGREAGRRREELTRTGEAAGAPERAAGTPLRGGGDGLRAAAPRGEEGGGFRPAAFGAGVGVVGRGGCKKGVKRTLIHYTGLLVAPRGPRPAGCALDWPAGNRSAGRRARSGVRSGSHGGGDQIHRGV